MLKDGENFVTASVIFAFFSLPEANDFFALLLLSVIDLWPFIFIYILNVVSFSYSGRRSAKKAGSLRIIGNVNNTLLHYLRGWNCASVEANCYKYNVTITVIKINLMLTFITIRWKTKTAWMYSIHQKSAPRSAPRRCRCVRRIGCWCC